MAKEVCVRILTAKISVEYGQYECAWSHYMTKKKTKKKF